MDCKNIEVNAQVRALAVGHGLGGAVLGILFADSCRLLALVVWLGLQDGLGGIVVQWPHPVVDLALRAPLHARLLIPVRCCVQKPPQ
jgi:hypothetical protein